MNNILENAFFSFLLKKKIQIPKLSENLQKAMLRISNSYAMSGFIIENCLIDNDNSLLKPGVTAEAKVCAAKRMQSLVDLKLVHDLFSEEGIDFVIMKGMALNANKLYQPGLRACRDIDILVPLETIPRAYRLLRTLEYTYCDTLTTDQTKVFSDKRHLPSMQNSRGTYIELHWRVSFVNDYKNCPLSAHFFEHNLEIDSPYSDHSPSIEGMIAHLLYHAFAHHELNHGPVFLFDLYELYKANDFTWPYPSNLINELGLAREYEQSRNIIEILSNENVLTQRSIALLEELFTSPVSAPFWNLNSQCSFCDISSNRKNSVLEKIFVGNFITKLRQLSFEFQEPFRSPRFWYLIYKRIQQERAGR